MSIIKDSNALSRMTPNDLEEYKEACKEISYMRDFYQENIENFKNGEKFYADFVFKTSESSLFFNIRVLFEVKRKLFKNKFFFKISEIKEITCDDYLDIMSEVKKYTDGREEN